MPDTVVRSTRIRNGIVWAGAVLLVAVIAAAAWYGFRGGGSGGGSLRAPLRQTPIVSSEQLVEVDVVDKDYNPRTLTINTGATVVWRFRGELPHNVVDDRGAFASDTQVDGEYRRTFDAPGTFYYYCTLHHAMLGTLIVAD